MSLRWRVDGLLVCAAKSEAAAGDTYIADELHYRLFLVGMIEPQSDERTSGFWRWRETRDPCEEDEHE